MIVLSLMLPVALLAIGAFRLMSFFEASLASYEGALASLLSIIVASLWLYFLIIYLIPTFVELGKRSTAGLFGLDYLTPKIAIQIVTKRLALLLTKWKLLHGGIGDGR